MQQKKISMNHKHFIILERENILEFLALGLSKAKIARKFGKYRSSTGREIKRNTINGKYSPFNARLAYQERKQKCWAKNILKESILLIDIQEKLENSWTPEQISERAKLDKLYSISFKTVYSSI